MCAVLLTGLSPLDQAFDITLHPGLFTNTERRLAVVTWLVSTLCHKLRDALSALNNRQILGTLLNTLVLLGTTHAPVVEPKKGPLYRCGASFCCMGASNAHRVARHEA